jgi:hypothetical protein
VAEAVSRYDVTEIVTELNEHPYSWKKHRTYGSRTQVTKTAKGDKDYEEKTENSPILEYSC